jgi:hypothetical protein
MTKLPLKTHFLLPASIGFLCFYPSFFVIIKFNEGQFGISLNIKIYLKIKSGWRVRSLSTAQHRLTRQCWKLPDVLFSMVRHVHTTA